MTIIIAFRVETVAFGQIKVMGVKIRMASFETIEPLLGLRKEYQRISFRVITDVVHLCFSCDLKLTTSLYNSSA